MRDASTHAGGAVYVEECYKTRPHTTLRYLLLAMVMVMMLTIMQTQQLFTLRKIRVFPHTPL